MKLACKRSERTCADGALSFKLMAVMTAAFAAMAFTLEGADPSWWSSPGTGSQGAVVAPVITTNMGVVTTNYITNDYAIVTQGQLKQFTARAVDELNAYLTNPGVGGAGPALTNLVYGWSNDYYTNGYSATNHEPSDYQAMNLGQLKYIASLVYGQLYNAGYADLYPSWLRVNTNDNAVANLGQLKEVFDFDLLATLVAPGNLTATLNGDGSVELTWQESSLNVTGFTIQQSTDGGTTWTTVGSGTAADVTDYTAGSGAGTEFKVIANNGTLASAASIITAPSDSSGAPLAPSGLTVTPVNGDTFALSWQNNATDATGIEIEGSKDGGSTWQVITALASTATTYSATPDTRYLWLVRASAQKSSVLSSWTDIVSEDGADTDQEPHYALIDIAPGTGLFVNNSGQAVYQDATGTNYYFWSAGTSTLMVDSSSNAVVPIALNNGGTVLATAGGVGGMWTNGTFTPITPPGDVMGTLVADYEAANSGASPTGSNIEVYPVAFNDSNVVVGGVQAGAYSESSGWGAGADFEGSSLIDDISIGATVDFGGVSGNWKQLTGINNSGAVIGSYGTFYNVYSIDDGDSVAQTYGGYLTGGQPLSGTPTAINDVGEVMGTDLQGHSIISIGGEQKITPGFSGYVNNIMQNVTSGGLWEDYRPMAMTNLVCNTNYTDVTPVSVSHDTGAIVGTATASETTPTISVGGETYTNTDLVPTPAAGSHGTLLLPLQLKLLNGSTSDFNGTIITDIIPSPENPQYTNDVAYQTGTGATLTSLGALSMGTGRSDYPANAYTCSTIVAAFAPSNLSSIQYVWHRPIVRRSWYIRMITDHSSPYYGQWLVTQRSKRGVPVPVDDLDQSHPDHNVTPSSVKKEFYSYDDSALIYGSFSNDKASGYMNVGDFIHEEKVFSYQVQTSFDGTNWTYGVVLPVTQSITVKYQATGGTAATDWIGLGNAYTVGNSTPIITVDKVRAIVGGTATINIDSAANN